MRKVTQGEYDHAKHLLSCYEEFCKPYVQPNGWTVVPADAKFFYAGEEVTTDRINLCSTNVELFDLERDMPAKFSAYAVVDNRRSHITTWTGEIIGRVTLEGAWHRNNMGARWRQLKIRTDWNAEYAGREYDSRQLVNFRRTKAA